MGDVSEPRRQRRRDPQSYAVDGLTRWHRGSFVPAYPDLSYAHGPGSLVRPQIAGMAGAANIGADRNWTDSHFDQANWYAFGCLAWDLDLKARTVAAMRRTLVSLESKVDAERFAQISAFLAIQEKKCTSSHRHKSSQLRQTIQSDTIPSSRARGTRTIRLALRLYSARVALHVNLDKMPG